MQCVLVEIDMGTLTLRRFARKVQAFAAALEDQVFRRHFKRQEEFDVLVLTQSRRRLEALRRVAGRMASNERHDNYYLTTFDEALAPSKFAAATWRDLDGEMYASVLYV